MGNGFTEIEDSDDIVVTVLLGRLDGLINHMQYSRLFLDNVC